MKHRALLALVAILAVWGSPRAARAEAALRVHLSWVRQGDAADACAGAAQVQADVAQRLGFSPFVSADAKSAAIEVLVTQERVGYAASVVMREPDGSLRGTRRVESGASDCRSLSAAAALAIAIMIDPQLLLRAPTPVIEKPAPMVTKPPAAPVATLARPESVRVARSEPRGALALGVVAVAGVLPRVAVGPLLRGELVLGRKFAVAVGAQLLPEQRRSRAGADARFGFTAARLGPCYRLELSRVLAVASCGSLVLGSLSVAINRPEPVDAGARLWLGGAVELRVGVQLGALELGLSAEALAHFNRRDYTVQRSNPSRSESLFTEPAAAGVGALTTGVRF